jgi:hypothetical protein
MLTRLLVGVQWDRVIVARDGAGTATTDPASSTSLMDNDFPSNREHVEPSTGGIRHAQHTQTDQLELSLQPLGRLKLVATGDAILVPV